MSIFFYLYIKIIKFTSKRVICGGKAYWSYLFTKFYIIYIFLNNFYIFKIKQFLQLKAWK